MRHRPDARLSQFFADSRSAHHSYAPLHHENQESCVLLDCLRPLSYTAFAAAQIDLTQAVAVAPPAPLMMSALSHP